MELHKETRQVLCKGINERIRKVSVKNYAGLSIEKMDEELDNVRNELVTLVRAELSKIPSHDA